MSVAYILQCDVADDCTATTPPAATMNGYRSDVRRRLGWDSGRRAGSKRMLDACPQHRHLLRNRPVKT